jgi:hypothetical protein
MTVSLDSNIDYTLALKANLASKMVDIEKLERSIVHFPRVATLTSEPTLSKLQC